MQERKTTTRAFRIDEQVDRQLREWAERERVSVSFLANRALRRLVEWDIYADRFGFMAVPNEAIAMMLDSIPDERIREIGRWVGQHAYRDFATFMFKKLDLETALEVVPKLTSRYTRAFEYDEQRDERRIVMVLTHGRGPKYSLYYAEMARALFKDFVDREIQTELLENAVVIKFAHPIPSESMPMVHR